MPKSPAALDLNYTTLGHFYREDNTPWRFGFNDQLRQDEVAGFMNHNTTLYWEYDTRIRWKDFNLKKTLATVSISALTTFIGGSAIAKYGYNLNFSGKIINQAGRNQIGRQIANFNRLIERGTDLHGFGTSLVIDKVFDRDTEKENSTDSEEKESKEENDKVEKTPSNDKKVIQVIRLKPVRIIVKKDSGRITTEIPPEDFQVDYEYFLEEK